MRSSALLVFVFAACGGPPSPGPGAPITNRAPAATEGEPTVEPAPDPAPAPAPARQPALQSVIGVRPLTRDDIRDAIKRHRREIQYCYEQALLVHPGLAGRVEARFTIDGGGSVTAATATGVDPDVDACIAKVIHAVAFPPSGGIVNIAYPFVFSSK